MKKKLHISKKNSPEAKAKTIIRKEQRKEKNNQFIRAAAMYHHWHEIWREFSY